MFALQVTPLPPEACNLVLVYYLTAENFKLDFILILGNYSSFERGTTAGHFSVQKLHLTLKPSSSPMW